MEIKKVISKGEILNAEQLAQVTGGTGVMANENLAEECMCKGTGDNTNRYKKCYCNGDALSFTNGTKSCGGFIDKPANSNPESC